MDATLSDPLVGRRLDGRYRVLGRLGRGGMGVVYRAEDERLDRTVALKVLRADLAHDPTARARFVREAKSAARIAHPGVVAVLDQGVDHEGGVETAYLVMELVDGRTLRDVVLDSGALSPGEALGVTADVLEALAEAHRRGVLHRDVKTANVLVADDGRVKVADFGLARAATSAGGQSTTVGMGDLMGTAEYLAPEQLESGEPDERSDVYGVGVMLYEMLTGAPPFTGESPFSIAYKHVHEPVPPPSTKVSGLPKALDALVLDALAKDPDERPADAGEMLEQLRAVRSSLTAEQLALRGPRPAGVVASGGTTRIGDLSLEKRDEGQDQRPRAAHEGHRSRRGLLVGLVLLLLAVAAGFSWYFLAGPGAYTTAPGVAGRSPEEATQLLQSQGLEVNREDGYSDTVAAGLVAESDPAEGERVRKDGTVTIVVSLGIQTFAVPNVVNTPQDDAEEQLTTNGLAVGGITQDYDEEIPAGSVIASAPAAGEVVNHDTEVSLVISQGRRPIDVPPVAGLTQDEARAAIEGAGLAVGEVSEEISETVAKGSVISQTPAEGTLFGGDAVALLVSSGPPLVEIPQVQGKNVDAARKQLEDLGFAVKVENVLGGIFGTVRESNPGAGKSAPKGSTITLTVV